MENMKPVLLCILDGWGIKESSHDNAIALKASNFKRLCEQYSYTTLNASEGAVGLPCGQMGNSEVGHATISLGRILKQDLVKIDDLLSSQDFFKHEAIQECVRNQKPCHLMGLLSPGGVHSHQNHISAIVGYLLKHSVPVYVHVFLDGRDTPPQSAITYVGDFYNRFKDNSLFTLASLSGRYYAMDRDQRLERTKRAYDAIAFGKAPTFINPIEYIEQSYVKGISDEFIEPAVFEGFQGIKKDESAWMLNFRADRVRQLIVELSKIIPKILGMNLYSDQFNNSVIPFLTKDDNSHSLGYIMAEKGVKQLRIAETEKYPHVTFFFNGGQEAPFLNEDRIMIPSPKVATYDLTPEMSAYALKDAAQKAIREGDYKFIVLNFANADMVGHTGKIEAIYKAIEVVDGCVLELATECISHDWIMVVTADHGNAEEMVDHIHHQPHTAHTLNHVPFLIIDKKDYDLREGGGLYDIAPTILNLMKCDIPSEMTGKTLIKGRV